MTGIEIGLGKSGRRGYELADLDVVPSRRTRDVRDVEIGWQIDAYSLRLPFLGAPMDSVMSPQRVVELDAIGGLGVLHAEGVWSRVEDADAALDRFAAQPDDKAFEALRELYSAPVSPGLLAERIAEMRAGGGFVAVAVTPRRTEELLPTLLSAEIDLLVIQGTVVTAEHLSTHGDPLNLKQLIRRCEIPVVVGGCGSYSSALHLMRTGAAGVLVGVGAGHGDDTGERLGVGAPRATVIADARAARMRHLDETGVYCHVIADGGLLSGGDVVKAVALGADAVMLGTPLAATHGAPGRGWHWGLSAAHPQLRVVGGEVAPVGTLEQVCVGPAVDADPGTNLGGALRKAVALCGFTNLKEMQKAELLVSGAGQ